MLVAGSMLESRNLEEVVVRDSVGRHRLISACKELIRQNGPAEQVIEVVRSVLRPNVEPEDLYHWWINELRSSDRAQARRWCVIGELLQCWSIVDMNTVRDLLGREEIPEASVISALLHASRFDVLEGDEGLFEASVEAVLSGERVGYSPSGSLLQQLADSVGISSLVIHGSRSALARRLSQIRYRGEGRDDEEDISMPSFGIAERCAKVVQAYKIESERPLTNWNTTIGPWDRIIQQGISEFGERKRFVELANIAAGVQSTEDKCLDSPNLFDIDRPIARRARYARLRAGSSKWWSKQLQSARNSDEVYMALLFFATWAGARTTEVVAESFDELIVNLGDSEWYSLFSSLRRALEVNSTRTWLKPIGIQASALPPSLSVRTAVILAERCTPATADELYERYAAGYKGDDLLVASLRADVQVRRALLNEMKWSEAIESMRSSYRLGASASRALLSSLRGRLILPETIAREVVNNPLEFPAALIRVAESSCRQFDASKILPVGQVATEEGWFED